MRKSLVIVSMIVGALSYFVTFYGQKLAIEKGWIEYSVQDELGHGPDLGSAEWQGAIEEKMGRISRFSGFLSVAVLLSSYFWLNARQDSPKKS